MGKKKAAEGPNKSELIRAYKAENPNAKPKEIVEALGKQGITVTPQTVSTVLTNAKKKGDAVGNGGKQGKRRGRKPNATANVAADLGNALEAVIAAGRLLRAAGSAEQAKAIIDRLGQETHG